MKRCTSIFLAGENLSALCNKALRPTYEVEQLYFLGYYKYNNQCYAWSLTAMPTAEVTAPAYPWTNLLIGVGCVCISVCVRERV